MSDPGAPGMPMARRRRWMIFGRLAYIEATQDALAAGFSQHLRDHRDERQDVAKFRDSLFDQLRANARDCSEATMRVEEKLEKVDDRIGTIIWKVLAGAVVLILALVAALLHFHPQIG